MVKCFKQGADLETFNSMVNGARKQSLTQQLAARKEKDTFFVQALTMPLGRVVLTQQERHRGQVP